MSFFIYCDATEKKTFSLKQEESVIRKLNRGVRKEMEFALRALLTHELDNSLEESKEIMEILKSLSDRSAMGRIVEWTLRQILNKSCTEKIQPIQYTTQPVPVSEKPPARRFEDRERNFRIDFLQKLIERKIQEDSTAYDQEREQEEMEIFDDEFVDDFEVPMSCEVECSARAGEDFEIYCD